MDQSADDALKKFNLIINEKWKDLSEADTRSKIIDPIFLNCLNWRQDDIKREDTINKGYIDYIFSIDKKSRFLIEAKKEGISFELPEDLSRRSYIIEGIISKNKDIMNAIEQASRYCYEKGIRFAVITNGHQFIVFEGLKIGSEWRKGKCLIFKSHQDIEDNFILFWNLFNKNSVNSGSFSRLLIENTEILTFKRPLDAVHNREETLIRNDLNIYLRPFIEFVFEEITQDSQKDVLKECYIYDKAYKSLDDRISSYFVDKMPYFSEAQRVRYFKEKEDSAGEFTLSFRKCEEFLRKEPFIGSVIVLLGGIGSGKTTFIHRFFNIILEKRKQLLFFYVDFRDSPVKDEEIESFIYGKIVENLNEKYADIRTRYLKEFSYKEPPKDDFKRYITIIFALLKSVGYSISVIIDNVDQHPQIFQQRIFQVTKHICDDQRIIAVLALREESFIEATQKGVQDAYYTHAFHIPSPRFEKLIEARINYILNLLKGEDAETIKKKIGTQISIEDRKQDIIDFFQIIKESIRLKDYNHLSGATLFLTSIASGNMRKALKMFNNFLTSGNTNIGEMLLIFNTTGSYQIPYHAFIKSVILGDSKYFLSDKNLYTFNVFDINTNFSSSNFLHLRILNYAFRNYSNISNMGKGFIEISKLKSEAEDVFISPEAIEDSLLKLAKYDLIQFENQSQKNLQAASYLSITPTGIYYLTQLIKRFAYLDLIWIDTPISDIGVLNQLKKMINVDDYRNIDKLQIRFRRVEEFLNYLTEKEEQEFTLHPEYKESKLMEKKFMPDILSNFLNEREYILEKVKNKQNYFL